jgi:hypothetical protein
VVAGSAYYKLLIGHLLGYKPANVLGYAESAEAVSRELQKQVGRLKQPHGHTGGARGRPLGQEAARSHDGAVSARAGSTSSTPCAWRDVSSKHAAGCKVDLEGGECATRLIPLSRFRVLTPMHCCNPPDLGPRAGRG